MARRQHDTVEAVVQDEDDQEIPLELVARLRKDVKEAAAKMSEKEARYLVDLFYTYQGQRIATKNQVQSLGEEPGQTLVYIAGQSETLEHMVGKTLDVWTANHPASVWARSICGIGPIIAAGLRAHIDITKCATAGYVWRYAGLDSRVQWLGREKAEALVKEVLGSAKKANFEHIVTLGERTFRKAERILAQATIMAAKEEVEGAPIDPEAPIEVSRAVLQKVMARRPWNAALKTLCWKIGQSFVKVSGRPNDFYGKKYLLRKAYETAQNEQGRYADQAEQHAKRVGKDTKAYEFYSIGKLPPGHIHQRAQRWATKLFLSHYHTVAYTIHYGKVPPEPYAMAHLGHKEYIPPPQWDPAPYLTEKK